MTSTTGLKRCRMFAGCTTLLAFGGCNHPLYERRISPGRHLVGATVKAYRPGQ